MRACGLMLGLLVAACGQQPDGDGVTHPAPSNAELRAQAADAPPAGSCIYGPRNAQLIAYNGESIIAGSAANRSYTALNPLFIRCTNGEINIIKTSSGSERIISTLTHFKFSNQDLRAIPEFQIPDESGACKGYPSDGTCTTLSNAFDAAYSGPNSETFAFGINTEGLLVFITVAKETGRQDVYSLFAADLETGRAHLLDLFLLSNVVDQRPFQAPTIPKSR